MKVIVPNTRKHPVLRQYQNQCAPQTAFLEFDPASDGELILTADYSGEIGNAVPASVWHSRILRFHISPYTTGTALRELRKDQRLLGMLDTLRKGYEEVWNGNNYVGRFDSELYLKICHYIHTTLGE